MKKLFKIIQASKQASANRQAAEMLQRTEYPNESVSYVLELITSGKLYKV